jgi:hypothetical protein
MKDESQKLLSMINREKKMIKVENDDIIITFE